MDENQKAALLKIFTTLINSQAKIVALGVSEGIGEFGSFMKADAGEIQSVFIKALWDYQTELFATDGLKQAIERHRGNYTPSIVDL